MISKRAAQPLKNWNDLNEAARLGLRDAIEVLASIEIVEGGNRPDVVSALAKAGAYEVALHIRDATLFRLHVIVCRAYAPVHFNDDRHLRAAIEFLERRILEENEAHYRERLQWAVDTFRAFEGDQRLKNLQAMRNKFLAHLARPEPALPESTYADLFGVTRETAAIWYALAQGAGQVTLDLDFFLGDYRASLRAYWDRWLSTPNTLQASQSALMVPWEQR